MSANTHIEWTDSSWSPIRAVRKDGRPNKAGGGWACQRVSPGCENCYAAAINKRLGTGLDYDAKGVAASSHYLDENALGQPLRWRRGRRIFLSSMTDLFGEWVTDEWIDRVFAVMALTPQHTYQVLTKRPARMREWFNIGMATEEDGRDYTWSRVGVEAGRIAGRPCEQAGYGWSWPLPNVWLGVSVEDQQRADKRIPELLATPAAVRFLSCEPLLGRVDLDAVPAPRCTNCNSTRSALAPGCGGQPRIDLVIVGGESGPGARPMDVAWARSLRDQCQAAGVAFFMKQFGSNPVEVAMVNGDCAYGRSLDLHNRKGSDMAEWPEDLRVREFPHA